MDPSGARIATGSHDYDTKLWDFGGMDSRFRPFKSFEANGNYYVCVCLSDKLLYRTPSLIYRPPAMDS